MRLLNREFPARKAKKLGIFLNFSHISMQEITYGKIHEDDEIVLIDVIDFWLNEDEEKSWTKLAKAVEGCGYGDLAANIRQKNYMGGES